MSKRNKDYEQEDFFYRVCSYCGDSFFKFNRWNNFCCLNCYNSHIRDKNRERLNNVVNRVSNNIRGSLSCRCKDFLRAKYKVGCLRHLSFSSKELILHLEKQFNNGMSWLNYGVVWHIGHRVPLSWFDESDFLVYGFCLNNLFPQLAEDNFSQSNNYAVFDDCVVYDKSVAFDKLKNYV